MDAKQIAEALAGRDGDELADLCCGLEAAMQPALRSLDRYVNTTVRGRDDDEAAGTYFTVVTQMREAKMAAVRAMTADEAREQAQRAAELAMWFDADAAEPVLQAFAAQGVPA